MFCGCRFYSGFLGSPALAQYQLQALACDNVELIDILNCPNASILFREVNVPTLNTVVPVLSAVVPVLNTVVPVLSTVVPVLSTVVPALSTVVPVLSTVVPVLSTVVPVLSTVVPIHSTVVPALRTVVPSHTTVVPAHTSVVPSHTSSWSRRDVCTCLTSGTWQNTSLKIWCRNQIPMATWMEI